jgi:hypothetical protein
VRFGSSHLRLAGHVLSRTTFCYPDSNAEPTAFGTASHMSLIDLAENDVDPSFRGHDVEVAAAVLPFPTQWHHGFRLHIDDLRRHAEYRGPHVVDAGLEIAEDGWLEARIIGDAARRGIFAPQTLKQLWHCTARYGEPTI